MNRSKYLFNNTLVLFVSNFSSKILIFFLLPLYTSILTTAEYGLSDLISTTVNILYIAVAFYIGSGVLRFTMDKANNKSEILSIGVIVTMCSTIVIGLFLALANCFNLIPSMNSFYGYMLFIYFVYCVHTVLSAYTKGCEKILLIGIAGIVSTLACIGSNVLLLLVVKMGIRGYLLSRIIMYLAGCAVYVIGGVLKDYHFVIPRRSVVQEVLKYSIPIAATELGWLICTSSDKYLVSFMLGPEATGLISAAHRLPTILSAFTSIFIQAWQLSAIKEYGSKDNTQYYSSMYDIYTSFAVILGSTLILFSRLIGSFLYRGEFASAWTYTPIYISALVVNTTSSFTGSIIAASKKTKYLFTSTMVGAVINLILDVLLIKMAGIYGAGIATLVSYFVISSMRMNAIQKEHPIETNYIKVFISYVLMLVLSCIVIIRTAPILLVIVGNLYIVLLVINRKQLLQMMQMVKNVTNTVLKK